MTDFSYQLYSSRKFAPLPDVLKMIADLGYTQAEGWGGLYASSEAVETLKAHLGANGLAMPTGHVGFEQIRDDTDTVIAFAKALGMKAVIAPIAPGRDMDMAGWEAFAAELAEASKPYLDAGLDVGYHNHHFEFFDKGGDRLPIEVILDGAPDIKFEMDVAWVAKGGHDPLEWISRYDRGARQGHRARRDLRRRRRLGRCGAGNPALVRLHGGAAGRGCGYLRDGT